MNETHLEKKEISKAELLNLNTTFSMLPLVPATVQGLPFGELEWMVFEALIYQLTCRKFGIENCTPYGNRGQSQEGLDVLVNGAGNKYSIYQCKKVKQFKGTDFNNEFKMFREGGWFEKAEHYCLVSTDPLQDTSFIKAYEETKILYKGKIKITKWGSNELNAELKSIPELVYRFFGDQYTRLFCAEPFLGQFLTSLKPLPERKEYNKPVHYIERELTKVQIDAEQSTDPPQTLFDTLLAGLKRGQANLLVRSNAAYGKTIELQQLVYRVSAELSEHYPLLISLKHYLPAHDTIESLLNKRSPNWENIPANRFVLVMDGIDEIPLRDFPLFTRSLASFLSQNPVNMVLSTRNNFFNAGFLERIRDRRNFEELMINELCDEEIEKFLMGLFSDLEMVSGFKDLCEKRSLNAQLNIPFYLVNLAEMYRDRPEDFPRRQQEAMKKIIEFRCREDALRSDLAISAARLLTNASKTSLVLSLKGLNSIANNNLRDSISLDLHEFKLSSLINVEASEMDWELSFIHANFQEYLFAVLLSKTTSGIRNRMLFNAENPNRLKTKFLNVTNFLFSLLDKRSEGFNSLYLKLVEHNVESLFLFEKDKIPFSDRMMIFERIIASFKTYEFYFMRDRLVSEERLWEYVDYASKAFEMVIKLLNTKNSSSCAAFIDLVCKFPLQLLSPEGKRLMKEAFLELITNDYEYFVHDRAIDAMKDYKLFSQDAYDVMLKCPNIEHKMIRGAVFDYLIAWGKGKEELQFILESWKVFLDDRFKISAGLEFKYVSALKEIMDEDNYKRIMSYLIDQGKAIMKIFRSASYRGHILEHFYRKLGDIYLKSNDYHDIEQLLLTLCKNTASYEIEKMGSLISFYQKINRVQQGIEKLISQGYDSHNAAVWIDAVDSDYLIKLIEKYKNGEVSAEFVREIRHGLGRTAQAERQQAFQELLKITFPGEFEYSVIRDYDADKIPKREMDYKLIDDQELFLKEAAKLFTLLEEYTGKTTGTWKDFQKLEYEDRGEIREKITSDIIFDTVGEHKFTGGFDDFEALILAEDFNWDAFRFNTIYYWLGHKAEPPVPSRLKSFTAEYFNEFWRPFLNVQKAITTNPQGGFTISHAAIAYELLFRQKALTLNRDELGELLLFDYGGTHHRINEENLYELNGPLYQVIYEQLGDHDFYEKTVRSHLSEDRIHTSMVMQTYGRLITEYRLKGLDELLLAVLADERWSTNAKEELLKAYTSNFPVEWLSTVIEDRDAIKEEWEWEMLKAIENETGSRGRYLHLVEADLCLNILQLRKWQNEMVDYALELTSEVFINWFFVQLGLNRKFDCRDEQATRWIDLLSSARLNRKVLIDRLLSQLDAILVPLEKLTWCKRKTIIHQTLKKLMVDSFSDFQYIMKSYRDRIEIAGKLEPAAKEHYQYLHEFEQYYYQEKADDRDEELLEDLVRLI